MKQTHLAAKFFAAFLFMGAVFGGAHLSNRAQHKKLEHLLGSAEAADKFICQLSSTDAGPSNTCQLSTFSSYDIWCQIPSCFKTGVMTGSPTDGGYVDDAGINCGIDVPALVYNYNSLANQNSNGPSSAYALPKGQFKTGIHNGIWALAMDAGNPGCNVSILIGGQVLP